MAHVTCDLLDVGAVRCLVGEVRPEVVVNTQALSDVDRCELEPELAHAQNVETTANLITAVSGIGAGLLHVSTDYVFDGSKQAPYDEADAPNPLSVYGRVKLVAERLVLECPRGVVARTSTLFGSARMNFCDHVVTQVQAGRPVEAFSDQVTSPTYTDDAAQGLEELVDALFRAGGRPSVKIVHVANDGCVSRVEFARRVAMLLGASPELIRATALAGGRRPAVRPRCSALATHTLLNVIGRRLPGWDDALVRYLQDRRWLG